MKWRARDWLGAGGAKRLTPREARAMLVGDREGPGHVLGIDQATCSGWAVMELVGRRIVASGRSTSLDETLAAIEEIGGLPEHSWASTLVVFERHDHIPAHVGIPVHSLLVLGEARQLWKVLLTQAGQPSGARVDATPAQWRKALGARSPLSRTEEKKRSIRWGRALSGKLIHSHDEAEAICLAHWGAVEGLLRWANECAELGAPRRRKERA